MSSASEGDDSQSQTQPTRPARPARPVPPEPLCVFFLTPLQPPALLPPLQSQPSRPRAARGERVTKRKSPAGSSRHHRDRGQRRGHPDHERPELPRQDAVESHGPDSVRRQAWPPPRSASLDRAPRRGREMGTGGRSVAIPGPAKAAAPPRQPHCRPAPAPGPGAAPHGHGQAARAGAGGCGGLPLRRYSVPETVMRRCSLRSEHSQSSDSGDGLSPTRRHADHDRGHGVVTNRSHVLDDNHNETHHGKQGTGPGGCPQCASVIRVSRSEVRCARRVSVERSSAQSSTLSTVSAERTSTACTACTVCSECYSAQLTTMHEEAQWSEASSERLCVHCGRRAAGSKPCTPREALADRYDGNLTRVTLKLEEPDGGGATAINQSVNVSRDNGAAVRTESKVLSKGGKVPRDEDGAAFTMATQTHISDYTGGRRDERAANQIKSNESVFHNEVKAHQSGSLDLLVSSTHQESSPLKGGVKRATKDGQSAEAFQKEKSSVSVNVSQDNNESKVRVLAKDSSIQDKGNKHSAQVHTQQISHVDDNKDLNTRQDIKVRTNAQASRTDKEDLHIRTNLQCRLTDITSDSMSLEERQGYRKLEDQTPELMSLSEGATSSFNLSLGGLSTNDSASSSASPTPTPSPTTFRSRRPSSERLSTPESLRSGPIDAVDMNLKSSSSSSSLDRSVLFSRAASTASGASPQTDPTSPQRARNPRFGARTSSSLDTRTPTPYLRTEKSDYTGKVHVVSETSSFIILDELDNDDDARARGAEAASRYRARQGRRGSSFEVLQDAEDRPRTYRTAKAPNGQETNEEARSSRRRAKRHNPPPVQTTEGQDLNDVERDSLNGSVVDMFGVDEEGNVLFSESGVQSRRGSRYSCSEAKQDTSRKTEATEGNTSSTNNINLQQADDSNNNKNNTRVNCTFHVNNNVNSMNSRNTCNGNGYRETVKSDHHSQEQTFFCGVKEVYSVTTEKVEKWGSESREWLEKTTSHRIQHQHPHQAHQGHGDQEKHYNLSNRINIANNNPILIASEILEIPPEQRFRTTALNNSQGRSGAGGPDFTLPSIRPQESSKPPADWSRTAGVRRIGEATDSQQTAPDMATVHVRFVNGDQSDWAAQQQYTIEQQNAQRQRRIVTDLVGTEPAEVQVAVPRYSALPRTRSMLVNTSSGEEDEDSDSDCLSCADSLESERTARSARKHDDKPVRGHVVVQEPKSERRTKRIRIQSPKVFFVSLSEDQTEEEDVPVSARMPHKLRDKLIERHTMVKLQMAQNKRFLRTVCNASMLQAHPARSLRVGVSSTRAAERTAPCKTEVAVEVETHRKMPREEPSGKSPKRASKDAHTSQHHSCSKGEPPHAPRERSRGKREVPAVVRVHKCHMEDQVKTTFKAKPYKVSSTTRIPDGTTTQDKDHNEVALAKPKEEPPKKSAVDRTSKRNVKVQVKSHEPKGKSHASLKNKGSQAKLGEPVEKNQKDEVCKVYLKDRGTSTAVQRGSEKISTRLDTTWTKSDYDKSTKKDKVSGEQSHIHTAPKSKQAVASTQVHSRRKAVNSKEINTAHTKETQINDEAKLSTVDSKRLKPDVSHAVETQTTPRVSAPERIVRREDVRETERTTTLTQRAVEMTSVVKQTHDKTQTQVRMESSLKQKPREGAEEVADPGHVHKDGQAHRADLDATRNVSTEVAARVRIGEDRQKELNAVCLREHDQPRGAGKGGTSVHTSVRTTVHGQDGAMIPLRPTHGDEGSLRHLLELGASLPDAGIRQKVVEVETTIQKNIVHHNVVQTETTVEKNVITKKTGIASRSRAFVPGVEMQTPTPPPITPRPAIPTSRAPKATGPAAPVARRQTPVQRFRQKFEVIPEERNGLYENRRFNREDSLSTTSTAEEGHTSSKGRAALHQRADDVDLTLSKGWINFYQVEDTPEPEEPSTSGEVSAVGRVEVRAVPEPPPPTHTSVAVGSSPPPRVVDAGVSATHPVDVGVSAPRSVDVGISATRPVDAASSPTRTVDAGISATRPVAASSPTRTIDSWVSATRSVDTASSPTRTIDTDVSTTRTIDTGVSPTRTIDTGVSATRTTDTGVCATRTINRGVSATRTVDTGVSATRTVDTGVSTTSTINTGASATTTIDRGVSATRTVDMGVSATRTIDTSVSARRPVDMAVSTADPVDVGVGTTRTMDAAVSTTRAADAAVDASRPVDVAVSTARAVDVAVNATKGIDVSLSRTDTAKTSPPRVRRPIAPSRPTLSRPPHRAAPHAHHKGAGTAPPASHRALSTISSVSTPSTVSTMSTASKAAGTATYQARAVGTTDLEDASTNTLCGPLAPPLSRTTEACTMTKSDVSTGTACVHQLQEEAAEKTRNTMAGTAGVAPCGIVPLSSCRRHALTRREKLPKITATVDASDVVSTSSDSTEYMAPPGARDADSDSTSPCWRRGSKIRPGRAARARHRNGGEPPGPGAGGLYLHQVPPQPQQAGPPPRDGVGWTVTLAGAGAKQQGAADLEMRLMFPAEDGANGQCDTKDMGVNTQPASASGRWSLTIRNQLPGDSESGQGLSLSMVPGSQDIGTTTGKRVGRSALSDKPHKPHPRRPLSLVWPRMHQDAASLAPPEMSEAETVLSVTGSAIQRRCRHLHGHRR